MQHSSNQHGFLPLPKQPRAVHEEDPAYPPLPIGPNCNWRQEEKNLYACLICTVTCNSKMHLQIHFNGKKHRLNVESLNSCTPSGSNLINTDETTIQSMAIIQPKLNSLAVTEPVIGLGFLTEYHFEDCFYYECTLCDVSLKDKAMSLHMIGHRHRMAHMKKFHYEKYNKMVEKHLSMSGARQKGAVWSQLFRDYAVQISTYRNGAFLTGKVKVSKVNYCRFNDNLKQNDEMLNVQDINMNSLSKQIFNKERQLQKREQMLTEKEKSLNEITIKQIPDSKRIKELRLVKYAESQNKPQAEFKKMQTNDETTLQTLFRGAEDGLTDLAQQFKNKPDTSSSKAEEFIIQESLINDAHKRNAQREVELILKLSTSDKKHLHMLMVQRKRYKASLQRLEDMVGSATFSHDEEIIKSQLVGALQKLKSEGRKILANALWLDNDEHDAVSCNLKNQTESSSLQSLDGTFPELSERKSQKEDNWAEVNYTSFEKTTVKADGSSRMQCHTSKDSFKHQQPTATFSHLERTVLENPTTPISIQLSNDQYNKHQPSHNYFGLKDKFKSDIPEINFQHRLTKSRTKFDLHHEINYKATTSNSSIGNSIKMTVDQRVGETANSQDGAALSDGQSTTSEMEDKIFQSLCKGSLAPIAKAFSDNPTLQAALKTWEGNQKGEPEPQHKWIENTGHSQQEDLYYDGDHQQYQSSDSKGQRDDYWMGHHKEKKIDKFHYERFPRYVNPQGSYTVNEDLVNHDHDPCDARIDHYYGSDGYPTHHYGQRECSYHEQAAIRRADVQTHFEKAWGQEKNLQVISNLKKVVKPMNRLPDEKTPLLSTAVTRLSYKTPTDAVSAYQVPRFPQRFPIRNPRHNIPRHMLRPNMPQRYRAPGAPVHSLATNFQTTDSRTRPPRFGAVVPRPRFGGSPPVRGLLRLPKGLPPNRGSPGGRLLKRKHIGNTSAPSDPRNPYSPSDIPIKRPLVRKIPLLQNPESNIS